MHCKLSLLIFTSLNVHTITIWLVHKQVQLLQVHPISLTVILLSFCFCLHILKTYSFINQNCIFLLTLHATATMSKHFKCQHFNATNRYPILESIFTMNNHALIFHLSRQISRNRKAANIQRLCFVFHGQMVVNWARKTLFLVLNIQVVVVCKKCFMRLVASPFFLTNYKMAITNKLRDEINKKARETEKRLKKQGVKKLSVRAQVKLFYASKDGRAYLKNKKNFNCTSFRTHSFRTHSYQIQSCQRPLCSNGT